MLIERLQEWADRATALFPQQQRVCVVDDALVADLRAAIAELTTSRATCARLQEEVDQHEEYCEHYEQQLEDLATAVGFQHDGNEQWAVDVRRRLLDEIVAGHDFAQKYLQAEAQVVTLTADLDVANEAAATWRTQLAERIVRDETLTDALRRYGQHEKGCDVLLSTNELHGVCTCGLAAVLRAASEGDAAVSSK